MSSFFDPAFQPRHAAQKAWRKSQDSIGEVPPDQIVRASPVLPSVTVTPAMPSPVIKASSPVLQSSSAPQMAIVKVAEPVVHKTTTFNSVKKYDVMAKFLHQRLVQNRWLEEYHDNMWYGTANLGTFVRRSDGTYARTTHNAGVLRVVELVAAPIAFTMSCDPVSVLLDGLTTTQNSVNFMDGSVLPVADTIDHIKDVRAFAHTGFYACLCRREHFIFMAASSPPELLAHASSMEANLVGTIWGSSMAMPTPLPIPNLARASSLPQLYSDPETSVDFGTTPNMRLASVGNIQLQQPETNVRRLSNSPFHSASMSSLTPPRMNSVSSSTWTPPRKLSVAAGPRPGRGSFDSKQRRTSSFSGIQGPRTQRRPSSLVVPRTTSISSEKGPRTSIESVPEDQVPEIPTFPRKQSSFNRNLSISSTRMGSDYRGSISEEVQSKLEFVEKAMEIEESGEHGDVEIQREQRRDFILVHSCLVACAAAVVVTLDIWCAAKLVSESRLDGGWSRWILMLTIPFFTVFSLFFAIVIAGSAFQLFGPLGFLTKNTYYYSAKAPKLSEHVGEELPHITIQIPVYKEGLKGVLVPTITSVLAAVKYYQAKGGTATIFVCEDGMQLISPELQEARKVYYELHNVAWCARPKQCSTPGPEYYIRRGKFKKASNLNYCLDFSLRVEDEFLRLMDEHAKMKGCLPEDFTPEEEDEILEEARVTIETQDGGKTWSAGDVRIGEFILLIDSDTLVPEDCLVCGALEMMESPEVAIIQHASGVMNVTGNTFENGITYFTNLIYTSITHAVGAGDVAPFVGHNAFLRWRAVQSIAFQQDGKTKFWSEEHVSEDFDVALRLQMEHFIVRLAGYHNGGFKEGVSLTVYDELARWEKYAYGCNELLFHPLVKWPTKGVFTPLFKKFLGSNIKITSKFTIIAYIGTYYAIAVGFPLSIMNYLIAGWRFQLDHFYQPSWKIFVGLCVVYNIISPISFAMLRYRMGQASYVKALWETIKWTPFFMLYFGGLGYHLTSALCCHFFSINIEWTTTAKELEKTGFKIGLDRVFRDFWKMYCVILPLGGAMIYLGVYAPYGWKISDFTVIVPLANQVICHAVLPFALGLF